VLVAGLLRVNATKHSGANPNCTPDELVYQIKLTGTTLIIAHSDSLETARKAGKLAGIPPDRVLILDSDPKLDATSVATLISGSISAGSAFVQKKLRPGEGKTKVAALYMSSGTTGPQKVWTTRKSGSRSNQLPGRRHKSFRNYLQSRKPFL
jgi:hypothetical protein